MQNSTLALQQLKELAEQHGLKPRVDNELHMAEESVRVALDMLRGRRTARKIVISVC